MDQHNRENASQQITILWCASVTPINSVMISERNMMIDLRHGDCLEIMKDIESGSVDCVICDPPYFKVKGKFDFIWNSFEHYLEYVEMWAIEINRVLSNSGSLIWFGHSLKIAYSQIILDKFFNIENSVAVELTAGHIRRSAKDSFRRFAPCSERFLFYSKKITKKKQCEELIMMINETANNDVFKNCLLDLGISKNEKSAKVLATYKTGKHKTRFDFMSEDMYDYINNIVPFNYTFDALRAKYEGSMRVFNSDGTLDTFRFKESTKDLSSTKHPTQKPLGLIEMIVKQVTNETMFVLDPFMGSGTTGVACKNLNRNFIGIELDETYFNIAKERIENHI